MAAAECPGAVGVYTAGGDVRLPYFRGVRAGTLPPPLRLVFVDGMEGGLLVTPAARHLADFCARDARHGVEFWQPQLRSHPNYGLFRLADDVEDLRRFLDHVAGVAREEAAATRRPPLSGTGREFFSSAAGAAAGASAGAGESLENGMACAGEGRAGKVCAGRGATDAAAATEAATLASAAAPQFILFGHSTGCQDVMTFAAASEKDDRVVCIVAQAPVNDREYEASMNPALPRQIEAAVEIATAGDGGGGGGGAEEGSSAGTSAGGPAGTSAGGPAGTSAGGSSGTSAETAVFMLRGGATPVTPRRFLDLFAGGADEMFAAEPLPPGTDGRGGCQPPAIKNPHGYNIHFLVSGADEFCKKDNVKALEALKLGPVSVIRGADHALSSDIARDQLHQFMHGLLGHLRGKG